VNVSFAISLGRNANRVSCSVVLYLKGLQQRRLFSFSLNLLLALKWNYIARAFVQFFLVPLDILYAVN
jgi:hypothetical protein